MFSIKLFRFLDDDFLLKLPLPRTLIRKVDTQGYNIIMVPKVVVISLNDLGKVVKETSLYYTLLNYSRL